MQLVGLPIFSSEGISIGTCRTTLGVAAVVSGAARAGVPRPIVGHGAFDRENSTIIIDDDQKERLGRVGDEVSGHFTSREFQSPRQGRRMGWTRLQ
jgi:hypothetical protein